MAEKDFMLVTQHLVRALKGFAHVGCRAMFGLGGGKRENHTLCVVLAGSSFESIVAVEIQFAKKKKVENSDWGKGWKGSPSPSGQRNH